MTVFPTASADDTVEVQIHPSDDESEVAVTLTVDAESRVYTRLTVQQAHALGRLLLSVR